MDHQHLESLYPSNCRFPEIEQILGFVKEGFSCQMVAMPGVGRSNVCKFLSYNRVIRIKHLGENQTNFHFVFVNFAEIKNRPLHDCIKFIFLEIVSSLHERRFEEAFTTVDAYFKDSLAYNDELVLFQGLKRAVDFLAHEKNLYIILLFERFEIYIPMLTDDFFVRLRSLRDTAKYKFSVVFSTTRPLEDTIEQAVMLDFFEFFAGKLVYLTLADMPGISFRIEYLEKLTGKKLGKEVIEQVMHLTGGHGKITRLATETLLATKIHESRIMNQESMRDFLLSQKSIQSALKEIWDFLLPSERSVILSVNEKRMLKPLQGKQVQHDTEEVNPALHQDDALSFLEKIGLLKNMQVPIPLLSSYLSNKNVVLEKETIVFDPSLNVIKKGNTIISESLTSSEFRLLRFLLENPDKILTREEIITAVWKETESTLGVTDQAVDQLLFRLRKKIEDNPTTPMHIQTIKGRGVKFVL